MIISNPGIYPDVTNEEYHRSHGLSNSNMTLLLPPSCPRNYEYHKNNAAHKDTDAFNLGTAVHTLCFEPLEFSKRFYPIEEVPKRNSNFGKAAYDGMIKQAAGRIIIDREDMSMAKAMANQVRTHTVWRNLMKKIEQSRELTCIEHSLAWLDEESNVLLRSRPDFYTDDIIIDLKTTKDSSPHAFARAVAEYNYHRQAALACDGLTALTKRNYNNVILFVVDKTPPHFACCYVLNESALQQGRYEYKKAALIYAECIKTQTWESYPEIVENLDIPHWAYRSFENEQ